MHRRWIKAVVCSLILTGGWGVAASAASWADALFSESAHDFGTVPRGGKVRHNFLLTNRLQEPLTIVNVRASCGCTTGRASNAPIAPGQSAVVEAEMDTRNFVGQKATTLFVTLITTAGREAEVRLGVSSTILSDVVLNPGSADFGMVARGQTPTQILTVDRMGAPNWRVVRMVSSSKSVSALLTEMVRNGSTVSYSLSVSLKPDAPAGLVRDEIRLITNDPETSSIPIPINAMIRGELSARPSLLYLGRTASSATVQGRVMVTASKPFSIVSVDGTGEGFRATPTENTRKNVQLLTVSYRPEEGTARGDLRRVFRIRTDIPDEPALEVTAMLHVDP